MLFETIASILNGDDVPTELIIVDQSDVKHPDLAHLRNERNCRIRYLWLRSIGLSRANNTGIAAARHELLAFTHDDVLVAPTWFGALAGALRAGGERTVVTGRVLPGPDAVRGGFAPALKVDAYPATYQGRVGFDVLKPLNMAMSRAALDEVGGFDVRLGPGTTFPGAEDSDLGFRLLESGYRIAYVPEAVLYHRAWRAERDYLPLRWGYGVAQGAFYAKHLARADRYMRWRIWGDVRHRLRRFLGRLVREPQRALGDPVFIVGNLVGALRWRRERRARTQG